MRHGKARAACVLDVVRRCECSQVARVAAYGALANDLRSRATCEHSHLLTTSKTQAALAFPCLILLLLRDYADVVRDASRIVLACLSVLTAHGHGGDRASGFFSWGSHLGRTQLSCHANTVRVQS